MTVNCVDIARMLRKFRPKDKVIMKMDIEGAEYDLIQDFIKKDVLKLVDFMAAEFHSFVSPFKNPEDVFKSLFKLFNVQYMHWNWF